MNFTVWVSEYTDLLSNHTSIRTPTDRQLVPAPTNPGKASVFHDLLQSYDLGRPQFENFLTLQIAHSNLHQRRSCFFNHCEDRHPLLNVDINYIESVRPNPPPESDLPELSALETAFTPPATRGYIAYTSR